MVFRCSLGTCGLLGEISSPRLGQKNEKETLSSHLTTTKVPLCKALNSFIALVELQQAEGASRKRVIKADVITAYIGRQIRAG